MVFIICRKKLLKIKELEEKKLNNDKIKSEKIVKIEKNEVNNMINFNISTN